MVETVMAIAVLGIGVASTIGALTKINSIAATNRNCTGAYTVLMNQVDLFQSMSPFNPQKAQIPLDTISSIALYNLTVGAHDISTDGTSYNVPVYEYKDANGNVLVVVNAKGPYSTTGQGLKVTVTDLSASLPNTYQAVFTITFNYLNKTYTYSMSTIRTSDI
jgi:hypothetical protein